MNTKVFSEIGRLRKVMVHSPGKEVDIITPDSANKLLFEDILFGDLARQEHEKMCKVFRKYGVDTIDVINLITESFDKAPKEAVSAFIEDIKSEESLNEAVVEDLKKLAPAKLGKAMVEGILFPNGEMNPDKIYKLAPIPNILFMRDPVILAFDKILICSMAESVRRREGKLLKFVFNHHPLWKAPQNILDLSTMKGELGDISLEGGDFLVIDYKTVAIACSVRTTHDSIKLLARELKKLNIENLVVVKLPPKMAFIHLDTTFTRINHDECLIYPPLYLKESGQRVEIVYLDLNREDFLETKYDDIFELFSTIGLNLKPIYCGGKASLVDQMREQWTQGANAVCIAPGVIMTYSRNINTIKALQEAGYLAVSAEEVLMPHFQVNINNKTVILLDGEELCRARGGPRCLTHPLIRE